MKRLLLICISLVVLLGLSGPADGLTTSTLVAAPRIKVKEGTSTNWSGYAVETNLSSPQRNAVTDVKGQWVVPSVTCTGTAYSSVWVGIDGYSDGTVEQLGTDQDCSGSTPTYYAWFEMYPKFPYQISGTVKPGDTVAAEVNYVGNNRFVLSMNNVTQGWSFSTTQRANARRSSAEWIVEAPSSSGGVLPLADFGTTSITAASATLNGHTGSISDNSWQNDAITMVTSAGTVKAQPSALLTNGTSFSDTWYHN